MDTIQNFLVEHGFTILLIFLVLVLPILGFFLILKFVSYKSKRTMLGSLFYLGISVAAFILGKMIGGDD